MLKSLLVELCLEFVGNLQLTAIDKKERISKLEIGRSNQWERQFRQERKGELNGNKRVNVEGRRSANG